MLLEPSHPSWPMYARTEASRPRRPSEALPDGSKSGYCNDLVNRVTGLYEGFSLPCLASIAHSLALLTSSDYLLHYTEPASAFRSASYSTAQILQRLDGYRVDLFRAPITACRACPLRPKCLRHPERTPQRQLTVIKHREGQPPKPSRKPDRAVERMRRKFDTPAGARHLRKTHRHRRTRLRQHPEQGHAPIHCPRETLSGTSSPSSTTSRRSLPHIHDAGMSSASPPGGL